MILGQLASYSAIVLYAGPSLIEVIPSRSPIISNMRRLGTVRGREFAPSPHISRQGTNASVWLQPNA